MTNVLQYPTKEDRCKINKIIKCFAQEQITRQAFMDLIANILEKYNIRKIHMKNYSIKLEKYQGVNIVILEGKEIHDYCPCCHSTEYRYIRTRRENLFTDHDFITVTCFGCGSVYDTFGYKDLENLEGGM